MKASLSIVFALALLLPRLHAADSSYLGGRTQLTAMHADTNFFVVVIGSSTNAAYRNISPSNVLEVIKGLINWPIDAGTNNPVTLTAGVLTLISGQTARYYTNSAGSFPFTFSGAPTLSDVVSLSVSNSLSSTIYLTNTAGIYDPVVASNVTTFAVAPTSIRHFAFIRNASAGWELESTLEKSFALVFGPDFTAATNGGTVTLASSRAVTNAPYAAAMVLDASTDVFASATNAIAGNVTLLLTNAVIGRSGSFSLLSDGSARTISVFAGPAMTWISTNATTQGTNILTAANKWSIFNWRVSAGVTPVPSTNIHLWNVNQP